MNGFRASLLNRAAFWAADGVSDGGAGVVADAAVVADSGAPAGAAPPSTADGAGDGPGAGDGKTEAKVEVKTESAPGAKRDWRDERIAKLTGQLRETQEKLGKVAPAGTPAPTDSNGTVPASEVDRLANERAGALSAQREFNARCDAEALKGQEAFGRDLFNARVTELRRLVDPNDAQAAVAYNQFLAAALETGEASRLIYELGGDLNEASRVLALGPAQMGVALARRASTKPEVVDTVLPKPITPVGARTASHNEIAPSDPGRADNLSTAEWMRRREAEVKQRNAA